MTPFSRALMRRVPPGFLPAMAAALLLGVLLAASLPPAAAFPGAAPGGSTQTQGAPPAPEAGKKIEGPTSFDTSSIVLFRHLIFVRLDKGFYEVMELLDFENKGKATVVSKDGSPTMRLALARSSNVRNPDARMEAAPHGLDPSLLKAMGSEISTTEPIPPGRKMVVYLYKLADEYGGITVEKPLLYGTENFVLLYEKDRVQAHATGFTPQDPVTFQERQYERFLGPAKAGSTVRFHIQAPASGGELWMFYAAGGAFLLVGGGVALWVRGRRNQSLSLRVEREALLRQIAALDDRLAQGNISPGEHGRERRPRFARLRELSGG